MESPRAKSALLPSFEKTHWFVYLEIVGAFCLGIWLPVRIVFVQGEHPSDLLVDLVMLVLVVTGRWLGKDRDDFRASKFWSTVVQILVAFPAASIASLVADGEHAKWFYLAKFLYFGKVLQIRTVLHNFGSLHPVIYRLLPVAFVLPPRRPRHCLRMGVDGQRYRGAE